MGEGRARLRARTAAKGSVVALLLLTLAACGGAAPGGRAPAPGPTSTSPVGSGVSRQPTVDDEHAMAPPGPRRGVFGPADLMVVSPTTLDRATVRAISRVPGVSGVETLALSAPVIENEALTLAAVNPATYRNWVSSFPAAQSDEVWARIAGGELGLRPRGKQRLPVNAQGFLQLGSAATAPQVHVGAYSAQAPLIDAVVNNTWVKTLGMTPDNALLIRTAGTAPKRVRGPIQKLLGTDASVQLVDLASRLGIDPTVKQVAVVTGTVADAVGVYRYTVLGGGRIAPAPAWEGAHVATDVVPILGTVTCNKALIPQLRAALQEVVDRGLADKINPGEYAGCYYPRFIAGTTTLSNHAFGLALDLNVPGNQRGTVGEMDRTVVSIFKSWGFGWGGDWRYTDPMHFEMAALVDPRVVDR